MKRLGRLLLLSGLLVVITVSAIYAVLATQQGSQWLLNTLSHYSRGVFQYQAMQGTLLKELQLSGIQYKGSNFKLQADSIGLNWNYMALLSGQLEIGSLWIKGSRIDVQAPQAETKPGSGGNELNTAFELPQLPLDINVRQFKVQDLSLLQLQQPHLMIKNADLSFSLNRRKGNQSGGPIPLAYNLWFKINALQGLYNEHKLTGLGELTLQDGLLSVQQVVLNGGQFNIDINGTIKENLDLSWHINIPELSTFSSSLKGTLSSRGNLSGNMEQPRFEVKLHASKLFYVDFSIVELKLDLHGDPQFQTLALKAVLLQQTLSLFAEGRYDAQQHGWQGVLKNSVIEDKQLGKWLQKTGKKGQTALSVNARQLILENYCLHQGNGRICARINGWLKDDSRKSTASLSLYQIPASVLKPWLPKDMRQLKGRFNGQLKANYSKILLADYQLELDNGQLVYRLDEHNQLALKFHTLKLNGQLDKQSLSVHGVLKTAAQGLTADITLDRKALENDYRRAAIDGQIKLNMQELGVFKLVSPAIHEVQGKINADISLKGTVANPLISGLGELKVNKLTVPEYGLKLDKTVVRLNAKPGKPSSIDIKGETWSGQGKLELTGKGLIHSLDDWFVKLQLNGENVQLLNTPEYQVTISPKLRLQQQNNLLLVKGDIFIPRANIVLNELPGNVKSISSDAVVLGEEQARPLNIDMDIQMSMGKKVYFQAFGINSRLEGKLRIRQKPGQLATANGELLTRDGTFRAYGQYLNIEQGRISYAGGYLSNPGINVRASKEVNDITVGVMASGTAEKLDISTFSSEPGMSSKDIVSMLAVGQTSDNLENSRISASTEITDKLSVGVNTGVGDESNEISVRYKLRKNLHIEGNSSAEKSGGNIIYTIEIE